MGGIFTGTAHPARQGGNSWLTRMVGSTGSPTEVRFPQARGKIDLRIQGFTRGSYGAETFADRLMESPPVEEELL